MTKKMFAVIGALMMTAALAGACSKSKKADTTPAPAAGDTAPAGGDGAANPCGGGAYGGEGAAPAPEGNPCGGGQ